MEHMSDGWHDPRLPARFWTKVQGGEDGCWHWVGARDRDGYGSLRWEGRVTSAHRVSFSVLVSPIPESAEIDHQCHNQSNCTGGRACTHRACVNPRHLELATRPQNQRRSRNTWAGSAPTRTHCRHGHEFTVENTIVQKSGRTCRLCSRKRVAEYEQTERGHEVRQAAKRRYNERHKSGPRTHCRQGHELSADNLYLCKGERICKICHKARAEKYLANNPDAVARAREATRRWRARQKQLRSQ